MEEIEAAVQNIYLIDTNVRISVMIPNFGYTFDFRKIFYTTSSIKVFMMISSLWKNMLIFNLRIIKIAFGR